MGDEGAKGRGHPSAVTGRRQKVFCFFFAKKRSAVLSALEPSMFFRFLCAALVISVPAWSAEPSAVGSWRTIDDATGRERSVVRIESQGGVLSGRVVSTVDPADAARRCNLCDDDRKGQPVIGLEIMRGMRADGDGWSGGRVLDPQTGSVYRGEMHLIDNGTRLVLRGYIGISLFGRSQTWIRMQ